MRKLTTILATVILSLSLPFTSIAHSGGTDSYGGHRDNENVSGLGYYHYHCGGHPAHLHENGVCPYTATATVPETTYQTFVQNQDSTYIPSTENNIIGYTSNPYKEYLVSEACTIAVNKQMEYMNTENLLSATGNYDYYLLQNPLMKQRIDIIYSYSCMPADQLITTINITANIQASLMKNGLFNGDINGLYDAPTMNAMILFQTANGLPQTGLPDAQTLALLGI